MSAPEWGNERKEDNPQNKPSNEFENSEKKPMLILIAGGTSSGKTGLAKKINKKFGVAVVSSDRFYKSDEVFKTTFEIDFDFNKPESIDKNLLISEVKDLLGGRDVLLPKVIFEEKYTEDGKRIARLTRTSSKQQLKTSKIIVVEGCHALQFPELREMADLKVFIDTNDDFRLMLKIMRSPYYKTVESKPIDDRRDFGRSREKNDKYKRFVESIMDGFDTWRRSTKPSETKFVLPTKKWADLVVPGSNSWEEFEKGLDKNIQFINLYFQNPQKFKEKIAEEKEKREQQKDKDNTQSERERERENKIYWMIGGGIISFVFVVLSVWLIMFITRKKKLKRN